MNTSRIEKFEDLIAWQKARHLAEWVYSITEYGEFSKDFGLKEQIRKASVSVMSNLAEGFERGGHSEFRHFLAIAKGSCAELKSQLYVALDADYFDTDVFENLYDLASEVSRLVGGLRSAVYKQKKKSK
jgi:four helix bundle protein